MLKLATVKRCKKWAHKENCTGRKIIILLVDKIKSAARLIINHTRYLT